jgi:hypothetical protein
VKRYVIGYGGWKKTKQRLCRKGSSIKVQSACVQEIGGQQRCSKSHLHVSRLNGVSGYSGYKVEHYSCSWRQGATESASGLRETARGIQEGYEESKRYCYDEVYRQAKDVYNQTILQRKKGDQKKKR